MRLCLVTIFVLTAIVVGPALAGFGVRWSSIRTPRISNIELPEFHPISYPEFNLNNYRIPDLEPYKFSDGPNPAPQNINLQKEFEDSIFKYLKPINNLPGVHLGRESRPIRDGSKLDPKHEKQPTDNINKPKARDKKEFEKDLKGALKDAAENIQEYLENINTSNSSDTENGDLSVIPLSFGRRRKKGGFSSRNKKTRKMIKSTLSDAKKLYENVPDNLDNNISNSTVTENGDLPIPVVPLNFGRGPYKGGFSPRNRKIRKLIKNTLSDAKKVYENVPDNSEYNISNSTDTENGALPVPVVPLNFGRGPYKGGFSSQGRKIRKVIKNTYSEAKELYENVKDSLDNNSSNSMETENGELSVIPLNFGIRSHKGRISSQNKKVRKVIKNTFSGAKELYDTYGNDDSDN